MKIVVASDHRGFLLKAAIRQLLIDQGHEVHDLGPETADSVDYPDFAERVGRHVGPSDADRGILICGSGIGMSLAANKLPRVRAAVCWNPTVAEFSRRHNDANVLCLSADYVDPDTNLQIVTTWLRTEFEGGRHARRVAKIHRLESRHSG